MRKRGDLPAIVPLASTILCEQSRRHAVLCATSALGPMPSVNSWVQPLRNTSHRNEVQRKRRCEHYRDDRRYRALQAMVRRIIMERVARGVEGCLRTTNDEIRPERLLNHRRTRAAEEAGARVLVHHRQARR